MVNKLHVKVVWTQTSNWNSGAASVNIGDTVSKPIPHVEATVADCATMRDYHVSVCLKSANRNSFTTNFTLAYAILKTR